MLTESYAYLTFLLPKVNIFLLSYSPSPFNQMRNCMSLKNRILEEATLGALDSPRDIVAKLQTAINRNLGESSITIDPQLMQLLRQVASNGTYDQINQAVNDIVDAHVEAAQYPKDKIKMFEQRQERIERALKSDMPEENKSALHIWKQRVEEMKKVDRLRQERGERGQGGGGLGH